MNLRSILGMRVPNWLVGALGGAVLAGALMYARWPGKTKVEAALSGVSPYPDPQAVEVQVLPQRVRVFDGEEANDPFTAGKLPGVVVTGIVINSAGRSNAILAADKASYVVGEGDALSGSEWTVLRIGSDSVTLACGELRHTVYLSGNGS